MSVNVAEILLHVCANAWLNLCCNVIDADVAVYEIVYRCFAFAGQ